MFAHNYIMSCQLELKEYDLSVGRLCFAPIRVHSRSVLSRSHPLQHQFVSE